MYIYVYVSIYHYRHSIIYNIYKAQGLPLAFDCFSMYSTFRKMNRHLSGALVEKLPNFRSLAWQSVGGFSSSPSLSNSLEGLKDVYVNVSYSNGVG